MFTVAQLFRAHIRVIGQVALVAAAKWRWKYGRFFSDAKFTVILQEHEDACWELCSRYLFQASNEKYT